MKKTVSILKVVALAAALTTSIFANGLSLNSIGARALGMGGAFIGLANDGTALYWNPAGLAGQKSSLLLFATDIIPSGSYKTTGIDATMVTNHYLSPNLFANYNMGKLSVALGVYVPAGLGAEWDPTQFGYPASANLEFFSKIGVINFSPGIAYQVTDKLSLGLAANIYYAMFDMKRPAPGSILQYSEESTGMGYGFTFGAKYQVNDQLSAGATFRLATKVTMNGTATNPMFAAYNKTNSEFDRDITWPMWAGFGLGYKVNDQLTLALDAQYSQWSELDELVTEYKESLWKAVIEPTEGHKFFLKWEDKIQIRLGAEYAVNNHLSCRLGYYYDPAPAPDETINVLFPSSTNHVITGGATYKMGALSVIGGLEYLLGGEREIAPAAHAMPGTHQMSIFAFSVGLGYCL